MIITLRSSGIVFWTNRIAYLLLHFVCKPLPCFLVFIFSGFATQAQLLFSESFDGAWTIPSSLSPAWSSAGTGNNQWQKNDFTTGWTNTASGAYSPNGIGGSCGNLLGSARFHSYAASNNSTGDIISPTINFSTAGTKTLLFWMINTSGTDKVDVSLSTDNGTTFGASLGTYTIYASWTPIAVSLGTSTSNQCKIRFRATSDFGTTDIGIDRVTVINGAVPLAGTYTINNTLAASATNFTCFTEAVASLNERGISSAVTFNVTAGQTFTEDVPVITATGTSTNSIVFQRSGAGVNPVIKPTGTAASNDAGIAVRGGDYFSFDGIDISINTGNALEFGYYFSNATATNGAQNNLVKNTKIVLNRNNAASIGICQQTAVSATSAAGANSGNRYYNLTIENVYNGIYFRGTSGFPDLNTEIGIVAGGTSTIGGTASIDIGYGTTTASGIRVSQQQDIKIFNCEIRNVGVGSASTPSVYGIWLDTAKGTNTQIYNNKIHDLRSLNTGSSVTVVGIRADVAASLSAYLFNNFVYNLQQSPASASATQTVRGIAAHTGASTGTLYCYHNSVRIETSSSNTSSTAFYMQSGTVVLKNNIFSNFTAGAATSKRYAIYVSSGTITSSDYNDLYVVSGTNNVTGYFSATDQATLANWRTASAKDANSISADPGFVTATNLHILTAMNVVDGKGNATTGYGTDIDGDTRCTSACSGTSVPDIGADEYVYVAPVCATIPSGVTINSVTATSATVTFTCTSCTGSFIVEYGPTGFTPGSGATASGGTVVTGGTTTINLSGLSPVTTYQVYVRNNCSGSDYSLNSSSVSFTTLCGALNVPYSQNFDAVTVPAVPVCFTVENSNADAYAWQTCTATSLGNATSIAPNSGANQMGISYNTSQAMNDWFFLPAINLTGGVSYRLSFYARGYTGLTEQIEVKYGTAANAASMISGSIVPVTTITGGTSYSLIRYDFTPSATGVYYLGFHGLSTTNQWYLFVDDITLVVSPPTLSYTGTPAFGATCINTTPAVQQLTINGVALTSASINVGPLTGYTFSTTSNGTYTSSLTLPQSGGAYSQVIYVKFNPTQIQSYNGSVPVSGGGATAISISVTGSGVNSGATLVNGTVSGITTTSALIPISISGTGCSPVTLYGIEYSTTSGFANGSGTQVPGSNLASGQFSITLNALNPATVYYFHGYATNGAGTVYSVEGTFTTLCNNFTLTVTQGFESGTLIPACWTQQFVTGTKSFSIGGTVNAAGTNPNPAAATGNNRLLFPSYSNSGNQTRLYSPRIVTTGTSSVDVEFNWYFSNNGTASSYLTEGVQVQYSLDGSTWTNAGTLIRRYGATNGWQLQTVTLPSGAGNQPFIYVGFLFTSNAGYDAYLDDIVIKASPPCTAANAGTISASSNYICGTSGSAVLSASGYTPLATQLTYQWQSSPVSNFASSVTDISGANNPASYIPSGFSGTIYFRLKASCSASGQTGYSNILSLTASNPQIASTTGATRCGVGTATISASLPNGATETINWYTGAGGTGFVGTGSNFTTPVINTTTTYYVAAAGAGTTTGAVGPVSPTAQGGTIATQTINWRVYFDVLSPTTLQSVDVYPVAAGESATLYVFNTGGTLLLSVPYTTTVSGGTTAQTIPINLPLTTGTGYNIYASAIPASGLKRNESAAVYPYTSSHINITGNGYDNTYFMCYYNWKFSVGCQSALTPVTVTVTPAPALQLTADAATICSGSSTSVSVSAATVANFNTYSWSPNTEMTPSGSPAGSSAILAPTSSRSYVITGTNSSGCSNKDTINVTVNPAPPATTSAAVCSGTAATLTSVTNCSNFTNAGTTISGSWNASTDPIAVQPVIFLPNSTTCEFDPDGNTWNYTSTTFMVNVTGTYTFQMTANTNYDGMGYIYTGPFVPGVCPGTGTWIVGDDDSGPSSLEPLMTANLVAGVEYVLITTCFSYSSGTITDSYVWNITAPPGGQLTTIQPGTLQWYTVPSGGTPIGTGSPFNPVGVAGSGIASNSSVGSYTYYAACSNNPTCRTTTTYVIGSAGQWIGGTSTDWNNTANWCGGIPTISTNTVITAGAPFKPVIASGIATVRDLNVQTGSTLTISNAALQVAGAITASGNIIASNGTLEMAGSTTQSLSGSAFSGRTIRNLLLSNSVNHSAITGDTLRISGTLAFGNVNNKAFSSGNNVTLTSSSLGTAMVADLTNGGQNSGNSISGRFVIERYFPARRSWRLVTAPVTAGSQTINQAWQESTNGDWSQNPHPGYGTHISGGPARNTAQGFDQGPNTSSIYSYSGTAWNVIPANTTTEQVTAQQGYMLFVRGSRAINLPLSNPGTVADSTIIRPTGSIKTGTQPAITNAAGGFTVIGNPYPAPVNFNALTRSGIVGANNTYYVWDPTQGGNFGVGAFVTLSWNGTDYDKSISNANVDTNGIIPSGAAVMVNFSPGGSIQFEESDKWAGNTHPQYQFRPSANRQQIRVTLNTRQNDGASFVSDGCLLTFNSWHHNIVTDEDALKQPNFYENLALMKDEKKMSIERRYQIDASDTIQLATWNLKQKTYELFFEFNTRLLTNGQLLYFEDTYLNTKIPMAGLDTFRYTFVVTTDPATASLQRFRLVTDASSVLPVTILQIKATPVAGNIRVNWQVAQEQQVAHYELYHSTDGRNYSLLNQQPAQRTRNYSWLHELPESGWHYYKVRCVDLNGMYKWTNVAAANLKQQDASVQVYPNPVRHHQLQLLFTRATTGVHAASVYNSAGQLVYQSQINLPGSSSQQIVQLPVTLQQGTYRLRLISAKGNVQTATFILE